MSAAQTTYRNKNEGVLKVMGGHVSYIMLSPKV